MMFRGSFVALITPFKEGEVDFEALEALVHWHIEQGTHGLVPVGTTGETPTLSHDEHHKVVACVIKAAAGRIPVLAGAGSNNTSEAIDLACYAQKAGADGVLIVTPYYNKPTQEGLYQHFMAIDKALSIPIILYNIPGRSVIDMRVETMARLYQDSQNIKGVKDATADLTRVSLQRHILGKDFIQFSGEDGTALGFNAHGGQGCISVTANLAPQLCAHFQEACLRSDYKKALEIQDRLMLLHDALFVETNPAPAKYALSLLGKSRADVRLPIVEVSAPLKEQLKNALHHAGLLT